MRAVLISNPNSTSLSPAVVQRVIPRLTDAFDLQGRFTQYPGHGTEIAAEAAADGVDVVIALGGDGTVNEIVNGLLPEPGHPRGETQPLIGIIPAGSANVFARSLGISKNALTAARQLVRYAEHGHMTEVGLGHDGERWMLFNAGFGMDAQVVAGIDELRERGARATPDRYVGMAIRDWWDNTQQPPQISVRTSEGQNFTDLPLALVTNQSPWTYLASFPVVTNPANSPTNGLGLFSLKDLNLTTLLRVLPSLIRPPKGSPLSITNIAAEEFIALERKVLQVDDAEWIEVSSTKPVHFQIDGEYLGETTHRRLTHHPKVLRVLSEPVKPGPFRGA